MMRTPWGQMTVEDSHAHLFSRSFFEGLARQRKTEDVDSMVAELGWDPPPRGNAELASRWTEELDRHGVARSVLMASLPGDEAAASDVVRAFPDRFYGFFMLDPTSGDPIPRARRAFRDLGLQGLCLFPAMQRFSVRDEALWPLYEAAAEAGRVVFVHTGVLTVGVRARLGLPSRFDMSYSNPLDLHRVALEHPETTFIVPHLGAGFFRETLMLASLAPNVYVDTSSSNSWRRFLTPTPTLEEVFGRALDVVGSERLMFGTDSSFFPRGWRRGIFETQCETLRRLGITTEEAAEIFGGNLARIMRPAGRAKAGP